MNDNQIVFKDENGKEILFNILFTFENDNTKYVLCYEKDNNDEIVPFKYDDEGNAYIVDDNDELKIIQEFLDSYDNSGDNDEKTN